MSAEGFVDSSRCERLGAEALARKQSMRVYDLAIPRAGAMKPKGAQVLLSKAEQTRPARGEQQPQGRRRTIVAAGVYQACMYQACIASQ